jgi:hypothetical protein
MNQPEKQLLDDLLGETPYAPGQAQEFDPAKESLMHNLTEQGLEKQHQRMMELKQKDSELRDKEKDGEIARSIKRNIMYGLIFLAVAIAGCSLYVSVQRDESQRKDLIAHAITAMTTLAGIAAGFGLK